VATRAVGYAVAKAQKMGILPQSPDWYKWSFTKPAKMTVDDGRTGKTWVDMWRSGLVNMAEYLGAKGIKLETHYQQRAMEIAKIDEAIGLVEADEMKHELNNSLSNLYEFYLLRQELLTLAFENLEAARLNLQLSKERFESGAINSFNYRDVQISYITIAQRQLEAVYNFIDAQTALLRMTGTIIQEYE
jgi:hypothetical protein